MTGNTSILFYWFFICLWRVSELLWDTVLVRLSKLFYQLKHGLLLLLFEQYIWSSLTWICSRLVSMIKKTLAAFVTYVFTYTFADIFTHIFSKRQKSLFFHKYTISSFNWKMDHFLNVTNQWITKVRFILSTICSSLELWSVNHTSIYENS